MRDPLARVSVRVKLTATFVALGALAFGVGGFLISGPSRRALEREVLGRVEAQSAAEAVLLDGSLALLVRRVEDFSSDGFIRSALEALAALETIGPDARAPLEAHLRRNKMPLVASMIDLAVWDGRGRCIARVASASPAAFAAAFTAERAWISPLEADASGRAPHFFVAAPVLDLAQARRVGTIVASIDVTRWFADATLPEGHRTDPEGLARIVVRDRQGSAVAVPRPPALAKLERGTGEDARDHEGRHACVEAEAFGRTFVLAPSGWTVTVERDAAPALAAVTGLESRFIAIGTAIAALCGVVFFFPLRFLIRPLGRLEEAARRVQLGDDARVVVDSEDEIGRLAAAFNHMATSVAERTRSLRQTAAALEARTVELRSERDRLDLVIRSMSDGLVFLDATGRIELANAAAAPLVRALEHGAVLEPRVCAGAGRCTECLSSLATGTVSCVLDVGPAVLEVHATRLPTVEGQAAGRVLVARDITRRVSEEARQMHQERLAVIGEVAAVIAHELNNPLAAISTFAQMLDAEVPDGSPFREHAQVIDRNVKSCTKTIRGLLDFARAPEPECARTSIHELVHEVVQFLEPVRSRARVRIEEELRAADPWVTGDELQLRQVLVNLILNAIQAVEPSRGAVRVTTADAGEELVLEVADDGPGVPGELRQRIFETFFTTKRAGAGTGLGLPISRRIAEAHGGSLELASGEPGRTTFRVRLPRSAKASPLRRAKLRVIA